MCGCCRVPSTCAPTGSGVRWPTRTASSRTKTSHRAAMMTSARTGSLPAMARQAALALPIAMQERMAVFKTQQPMTTSAAAMQHEMHPSRAQTDICTSQARGKTQRMQAQALRPLFRWVAPSNRYMPFALFILPEHFAAMLHRSCGHSSRQYYIGVLQPVLSPFYASVCSIRNLSVLMLRLRTPKSILWNVETNDSMTDVRSLTEVSNHPEVRTSLVTFMHQALETETAGVSAYVSKSAASEVPSS